MWTLLYIQQFTACQIFLFLWANKACLRVVLVIILCGQMLGFTHSLILVTPVLPEVVKNANWGWQIDHLCLLVHFKDILGIHRAQYC